MTSYTRMGQPIGDEAREPVLTGGDIEIINVENMGGNKWVDICRAVFTFK